MYYFLQSQALQRWTLMYVIRFSKINRSSIERPYNMIHNYLFVKFLSRKNSGLKNRIATRYNAPISTPASGPLQFALPF